MLREALVVIVMLLVGCGKADAFSDAASDAPIACDADQDCPGWEQGTGQCGYLVADGCSAAKRCYFPCPPGKPDPACACDGSNTQVGCGQARQPIAHLGYCDAGSE